MSEPLNVETENPDAIANLSSFEKSPNSDKSTENAFKRPRNSLDVFKCSPVRSLRSGSQHLVTQSKETVNAIGKSTKSGACSSVPTLQNTIDKTFKNELARFRESGKELRINDPILARMSGYPPWPADIKGFTKDKNRIKCYFYGSHNIGSVDYDKAIPFFDSIEIIRLLCLRKTKDFEKGIKEIEIKYGVPQNFSCLKEIESVD